jgi:hypothetical protein
MKGHCLTTATALPFLDFPNGTPYTCPRFKLSVRWTSDRRRSRAGGSEGRRRSREVFGPRLLPAPPSTQLAYLRDNPGGTVAPEDTVCQAGRSLDF